MVAGKRLLSSARPSPSVSSPLSSSSSSRLAAPVFGDAGALYSSAVAKFEAPLPCSPRPIGLPDELSESALKASIFSLAGFF